MLSLHVDKLSKCYADGTVALTDVSFNIQPGEGVVLLGPNGSGKSSLFRSIVGLVEANSGKIWIGDVETTAVKGRKLRNVRKKIGLVFQKFHLVGNLTVFHNVLFGGMGRNQNPLNWWPATASSVERQRIMKCLERVGLDHLSERRADQLSGGQQQRVAIARMLMQDPEIILADEPVASLDPKAGREVMDLLWDIVRERKLTVVCTLHQLDFALEYADRIIGLREGRVTLDDDVKYIGREKLEALYGMEMLQKSGFEDDNDAVKKKAFNKTLVGGRI